VELVGTNPLVWSLKTLQRAKSWSLTIATADSARTAGWMAWYRKRIGFAKRTAQQKQGFEFKVFEAFCWEGALKRRV
jgi:hypothetical protein